jgi:hypothetical protein
MGKIADGLYGFLEPQGPHLVEEQGKDNGRRETEHQFKGAYDKGIPEYLAEASHAKEELEVIKPDPGTFHDAKAEDKIFEGNLNPVHGGIAKDSVIDNRRQEHQYQILLFPILARKSPKFSPFHEGHSNGEFSFVTKNFRE